jgi:putative transcriptional regulator
MTITHHLDDATLMSLAAGSLPGALAAVAAAHASMCPRCRRELAMLETLGGVMLADLAPAASPQPGPRQTVPAQAGEVRQFAAAGEGEIPGQVARLVGGSLDSVPWRWLGPGVWDHLMPHAGLGRLRLLRVAPGRNIPEHGHGGMELTLVLRGSFHDETGRYVRGDVAELDETTAHQPVADAGGDCICLVASEKAERFSGLIARQWQRLRRI